MKNVSTILGLVLFVIIFGGTCDAGSHTQLFLVEKIISNQISNHIKPIAQKLNEYCDTIRVIQKENKSDALKWTYYFLGKIAEALEPGFSSIFRKLNQMGLMINDRPGRISSILNGVLEKVDEISDENKTILRDLSNKLIYIVSNSIGTQNRHATPEIISFIHRMISRMIQRLISPIATILNEKLTAIRQILAERHENAQQLIDDHLRVITNILKAPIVEIIGILDDMGVDVGDISNQIKMILSIMADTVKSITDDNKEVVHELHNRIIAIILGVSNLELPYNTVSALSSDQTYFVTGIMKTVFNRLVQPIINKINYHLDIIQDAIKNHATNVQEIINQQVLEIAELIRPSMIRIINILNNMGVHIQDLASTIQSFLNAMIDSVGSLTDANKQLMKKLLAHVTRVLLKLLGDDELTAYFDPRSLLDIVIRPLFKVFVAQIKSIAAIIKGQGPQITEAVKQHINNLASLLRPIISKLYPNDLNDSTNSVERVTKLLQHIFNNIGDIPGVGKDSIKVIIDYLAKVLTGEIVPTVSSIA